MREEIEGSEFVRAAVRIPSRVSGPTLPSPGRCRWTHSLCRAARSCVNRTVCISLGRANMRLKYKRKRVLRVAFYMPLARPARLPRWPRGKASACQCRRCKFDPWVRKIPWRRKWLPIPVFLPGISHGQRSLVDYSPWGHGRVRHDLETKHSLGKGRILPLLAGPACQHCGQLRGLRGWILVKLLLLLPPREVSLLLSLFPLNYKQLASTIKRMSFRIKSMWE